MRHRLAQRQAVLGLPDLALEDRGEGLGRGHRPYRHLRLDPGQGVFVILDQLGQAEGQATEGQLVAGQHQMLRHREGPQPGAAFQPFA